MSLSGTGKRYSANGGRNRRKRKKTIQKLILVANEEKKKNLPNRNKILTKKTIIDKTKPKKLKK